MGPSTTKSGASSASKAKRDSDSGLVTPSPTYNAGSILQQPTPTSKQYELLTNNKSGGLAQITNSDQSAIHHMLVNVMSSTMGPISMIPYAYEALIFYGVTKLFHVAMMSNDDINKLFYEISKSGKPEDRKCQLLSPKDQNDIRSLQIYIKEKYSTAKKTGQPFTHNEMLAEDVDNYETFCMDLMIAGQYQTNTTLPPPSNNILPPPPITSSSQNNNPGSTTTQSGYQTPLHVSQAPTMTTSTTVQAPLTNITNTTANSNNTIRDPTQAILDRLNNKAKIDITKLPQLKDPDRHFEEWVTRFKSMARSQGYGDILAENYVMPTLTTNTQVEVDIHTSMSQIIYDGFEQTLKSPEGKNILITNNDGDGYAIWKQLNDTFRRGPTATLAIAAVRDKLTNMKIGGWKSTPMKFLLEFELQYTILQDMLRRNNLQASEDDDILRTLKAALRSNNKCSEAENSDLQLQARGLPALKLFPYIKLLKTQFRLTNDDDDRPKRRVNEHNTTSDGKGIDHLMKYKDDKGIIFVSDKSVYKNLSDEQHSAMKAFNSKARTKNRDNRGRGGGGRGGGGRGGGGRGKGGRGGRDRSSNSNRTANKTETAKGEEVIELVEVESDTESEGSDDIHDADIRKVLATKKSKTKKGTSKSDRKLFKLEGKVYAYKANVCSSYRCSKTESEVKGALIDDGANGGMAGVDTLVMETSQNHVDVTGIDGKAIDGIPLGTAAGLVQTTTGPVILIMHNYALLGRGRTIHAVPQLLDMGNSVDSRSRKLKYNKGTQRIVTIDNHIIPLSIRNGLAYMDMTKPTEEQVYGDEIPQVFLTNEANWDPSVLDNELNLDDIDDINHVIGDEEIRYDNRVSDKGEFLLHNTNNDDDMGDVIQTIIENCEIIRHVSSDPHVSINSNKVQQSINKARTRNASKNDKETLPSKNELEELTS